MQLKVKEEKGQGKMISNRWEDEHLDQGDCFAWLRERVQISVGEPIIGNGPD